MHLRRLIQNIPGLFLVVRADASFTIEAASDDYLVSTHKDRSIFGQPVFSMFPESPAAADLNSTGTLRASFQRVIGTRTADTLSAFRYDVRNPVDGEGFEERYWNVVNAPILDDAGEVEFILQRIEEASAKSRRDAVAILESITEGFFTLDRRWRFDYVNSEAHRILGRELGTLEGRVLWQEYPGLEGTEFERSYQRTMLEREKTTFTAYYPVQQRWYEVATFPSPEGVSVYFRNVTESRRLQAERDRLVVESEQQRRIYETALNSTPDFVYVFDLEHRALYANEALLKVWGVDDVRGKRWMDLGYEQWHADRHDAEIDQVIRTAAPIRAEIPFTGTNGTRVYDYIFAPVLGPEGQVVAVAGTTRDITDRQAAEQSVRDQARRLAELDRAKDEFIATLSHELRNPLASLSNSLALLGKIDAGNPRTGPSRAVMERQLNHLVRLVDDLLEISRISQSTLSLRRERVELAAIVQHAVETSEPHLAAGGQRLDLQLPAQPVWVEGDPVRLAQLLANLLNNAAKYSGEGGRVTLRCRCEGNEAVVSIADTGIGIDPAAMPRMFEMFSRGASGSGQDQGGLGIGLALSRRLAQMHGGTLTGHSEGVGRGSEFTLRLPLGTQAAPAAPAPSAPLAMGGLRVLVVDDNEDAGDSLGEVLKFLGCEVQVVRSGEQALRSFAAVRPRVVLLDIGMPGMDGYETARALRAAHPDSGAVLVALTGWGQEEDKRRAREAGFDHHLVKPADIDALQALLGDAMALGSGAGGGRRSVA